MVKGYDMTKQDILNLDSSQDIMLALHENRELWDPETTAHLAMIARKENFEQYGNPYVLVTPLKRKTT